MSTNLIGVGTTADDSTGDTLRAACQAINTIIQKADATTAQKIHVFEDTDDGTNKCVITAGTMASDRTLTCPTGGDLALESVRLMLAKYVEPASGVPSQISLLEDSDNGTSAFILKAPSSLAANRTVTGPTGGDIDLEVARTKLALVTEASAGTGTQVDLFEPTGGGTSKATIVAPALGGNITVTLPTASLNLDSVRLLDAAWTDASASGAASLAFLEDTDNGTHKAVLTGAASLAGDTVVTLPDTTCDLANAIKFLEQREFAGTANTTITWYIMAPVACTVTSIKLWAPVKPASAGGTYLFSALNGIGGNTMLDGATFDLETLTSETVEELVLTGTGADLVLTAGDVIVVSAVSNNADLATGRFVCAVTARM